MTAIAVGSAIEFPQFPKIARLDKPCVITEKIDGTNASVHITLEDPSGPVDQHHGAIAFVDGCFIRAGSRNRWITPAADNAGFAAWVNHNATELVKLGPGAHYGEWYGSGIQRGYGLADKRFALFNVGRWTLPDYPPPACCHTVPVLWAGNFLGVDVEMVADQLQDGGSRMAAPRWTGKPEGVMVYLTAPGIYLKHSFDPKPKGLA